MKFDILRSMPIHNIAVNKLQLQHNKQFYSAFSLIELAVVMAILGTIMTISIGKGGDLLNNNRRRATVEKLQVINQALTAYVALNGSLPAPASFKEHTGAAIASLAASGTQEGAVYAQSVDGGFKLLVGAIPTKQLGLALDYMQDGWGNYFSYRVLSPYTFRDQMASCPDQYSNLACFGRMFDFNLGIKIKSGNQVVNSNAVYAVISHGPNGKSAFSEVNQGRQNVLAQAGSVESKNSLTCSAGVCSLADPAVTADYYSEAFDDLVVFKDRLGLLMELELKTLPCREVTLNGTQLDSSFGAIITLPEEQAKQLLINADDRLCPPGYTVSRTDDTPTGQFRLQCSSYGLWKRVSITCTGSSGS